MKLPLLDTFTFNVTVPSTNESLTMRPFLVKEEKLLLLAQESKNYSEQVDALSQVIKNCSNGKIDAKKTPFFDIEYLLVQLRARSVGEIITPLYVCHNVPEGQEEECGFKTPVKINLQEVAVKNQRGSFEVEAVELTDRYSITLRYPNVYTIQKMIGTTPEAGKEFKPKLAADAVDSVVDLFDTLTDKQTGTIYKFDNIGKPEKLDFLNSLTTQQYEKVVAFLNDMPSVELSTEYTCSECNFVHKITLKGLADFLV